VTRFSEPQGFSPDDAPVAGLALGSDQRLGRVRREVVRNPRVGNGAKVRELIARGACQSGSGEKATDSADEGKYPIRSGSRSRLSPTLRRFNPAVIFAAYLFALFEKGGERA
jgi:hypothetical protein